MAGFFSFDSVRQLTTPKEEDETGCIPELSMKERVTAFTVCFCLGILVYMLSLGSVFGLLVGSTTKFALMYTAGNILTLAGTTFLVGFKRQFKSVFDQKRRVASVVFLGSLVMTLVSAIVLQKGLLTLLFIIVQVCAFMWYIASYVPWGRDCLQGCVTRCCRCLTSDS